MQELKEAERDGEAEGSMLEGLPYGASMMQDKRVARAAIKAGVLLMAFGAALFSVAWCFKWQGLLETAFVATLIAWMLLILSSAFWIVSTLAEKMSLKKPESEKKG